MDDPNRLDNHPPRYPQDTGKPKTQYDPSEPFAMGTMPVLHPRPNLNPPFTKPGTATIPL